MVEQNLNMISLIVGSTVLAAIITAFIAKRNTDKNHLLEYIVQERKKWRDDIRTETEKMMNSRNVHDISKYYVFLQMRLNPEEDIAILKQLKKIIETKGEKTEWCKFSSQISELLKDDWDRSKREVNSGQVLISFGIHLLLISVYLFMKHNLIYNFLMKHTISRFEIACFVLSLAIYILVWCFLKYLFDIFLLKKRLHKRVIRLMKRSRVKKKDLYDLNHPNFLFDEKQIMAYFEGISLFEKGVNFDDIYAAIKDELVLGKDSIAIMSETFKNEADTINRMSVRLMAVIGVSSIIFAILTAVMLSLSEYNTTLEVINLIGISIIVLILYIPMIVNDKKSAKEIRKTRILLNFLNFMKRK